MFAIDCAGLVRSRQGYTLETTHLIEGHKVRTHIYRDSYDMQNRIYAEVWSPTTLSWNRVITRQGEQYAHLPSYAVRDDSVLLAALAEVEDDLVGYVHGILS